MEEQLGYRGETVSHPQQAARFVVDDAGILQDANLDACVLLDMGRRALIGKRFALFVDRKDIGLLGGLLQPREGRGRSVEVRLRNRIGHVQRVRLEGAGSKPGTRMMLDARPIRSVA